MNITFLLSDSLFIISKTGPLRQMGFCLKGDQMWSIKLRRALDKQLLITNLAMCRPCVQLNLCLELMAKSRENIQPDYLVDCEDK